jgi:hypothetical protein
MFQELLDSQQIPSAHPRLVELAQQIQQARSELADALVALDEADPT